MSQPRMTKASWHSALDAQMGLWRWYRTDFGGRYLAASYKVNSEPHDDYTRGMLRDLYESEHVRPLMADPVFVSAEMVDVIEAASAGFVPEPLLESDLLTRAGFVMLERPIVIPDRFDEPTDIAGFSWSWILKTGSPEMAAEVKRRFREGNYHADEEMGLEGFGIALTLYRTSPFEITGVEITSPIVPLHLTPWWFGMAFDGDEMGVDGVSSGAEWWWKVVQTTLRLMQQQISVRHRERPHRSSRREAARLGMDGERDVVVVRLRREKQDGHEPPGGDANYSHRFIVSGHWRNQWYPSAALHRQMWISPYVKGPEDQPLVVRPRRVFTLTR